MFRRASNALLALSSWEMEMTALMITMSRMMTGSAQSLKPLEIRERAAATSRTMIIGSRSWFRKRLKRLSFFVPSS